MKYNRKDFVKVEKLDDQIRLISKPTQILCTYVVTANEKEKRTNIAERFWNYYVKKM